MNEPWCHIKVALCGLSGPGSTFENGLSGIRAKDSLLGLPQT